MRKAQIYWSRTEKNTVHQTSITTYHILILSRLLLLLNKLNKITQSWFWILHFDMGKQKWIKCCLCPLEKSSGDFCKPDNCSRCINGTHFLFLIQLHVFLAGSLKSCPSTSAILSCLALDSGTSAHKVATLLEL